MGWSHLRRPAERLDHWQRKGGRLAPARGGLRKQVSADVCWFDTEPALMNQLYVLKQSVNSVRAKLQAIDQRIDVQSLQPEAAPPTLEMNDIARVRLKVTKPIAFDLYEDNRTTGAFVLIDERTNRTVSAGTIR